MPQMTLQEFVNMLIERPGSTALTLHSVTDQRSKLKVAWYRDGGCEVFKKSRTNGMINYKYEDAVNRQRAREGKPVDFQAESRTWGERIPHTPFVRHNGSYYVTMKVQSAKPPKYVDGPGPDANDIEKPADEYWRSRGNSSRQGVDNQIIHREFRLDHLTAVTIRGETHDIVQGPVEISL